MKKSIIVFIVGVVAGVALAAILTVSVLSKNMFVVLESKYDFGETVEQLEKSATAAEWGIPHRYDLQKTLKGKGFEIDAVNVFSLCKPEHAYGILGDEEQRMVSALMPCRVAVYEKGGKTYISMLNSGLFSRLMGEEVQEIMGAASSENLEILQPLVD